MVRARRLERCCCVERNRVTLIITTLKLAFFLSVCVLALS
jgi:hypothetical protein